MRVHLNDQSDSTTVHNTALRLDTGGYYILTQHAYLWGSKFKVSSDSELRASLGETASSNLHTDSITPAKSSWYSLIALYSQVLFFTRDCTVWIDSSPAPLLGRSRTIKALYIFRRNFEMMLATVEGPHLSILAYEISACWSFIETALSTWAILCGSCCDESARLESESEVKPLLEGKIRIKEKLKNHINDKLFQGKDNWGKQIANEES